MGKRGPKPKTKIETETPPPEVDYRGIETTSERVDTAQALAPLEKLAKDGLTIKTVSEEQKHKPRQEPPPKKYATPEQARKAMILHGIKAEWLLPGGPGDPGEMPWVVPSKDCATKNLRINPGPHPVVKFITINGRDCIYAPTARDMTTGEKPFCYFCETPIDGWVEFGVCTMDGHPPNIRIGPCCSKGVLLEELEKGTTKVRGVCELIEIKETMKPDARILEQRKRMEKAGLKLGVLGAMKKKI